MRARLVHATWPLVLVALPAAAACAAGGGPPPPIAAQSDLAASTAPSGQSVPASASSTPAAAPSALASSSPPPASSSPTGPAADPFAFTPSKTFSAWTDAVAIGELAKDCTFVPEGATTADTAALLACKLTSAGSSTYDPCATREQKCRENCSSACGACDKPCVSSCSACESRCKDDACRKTCAKTAGACKQACLETLDKCATATCAPPRPKCESAEAQKWKANGCDAKCVTWKECAEQCSDGDKSSKCIRACDARMAPCDAGYCSAGQAPGE